MLLEPAFRLLLTDWLSAAYVDGSRTGPSPTACATGARLRLSGATLDERIDGLVGSADFFGLNYYFRYFVRMAPASPETA